MKELLITLGLGLLVAGNSFAGGDWSNTPQQVAPPEIVVVTPPSDNTAIYVGAGATIVTGLGVALIGLRNRKRK